jgi:aryl-alcohol dehydrogenase-like predicted oxidoreductase
MEYRSIGADLPPISMVSLGSWNTFSRMPFEECMTLLERSLECGVNLFDVAFYWDKPHTEVIFGRAMQAIGAARDSYLLAEKLWLWDYPQQPFERQLRHSLTRLGTDYVDLVMVSRANPGIDLIEMAEEVAALVESGLARGWGMTNWEAADILRIDAEFRRRGKPRPRLVQLQYNVARRSIVESEAFAKVFAETDVKLCAAFTLEGGILGGHLQRERVQPSEYANGKMPHERNIARDAGGIRERIRANMPAFEAAAAKLGVRPARLALAFCLSHPSLATALVGITRLDDLSENIAALDLAKRRAELLEIVRPFAIDHSAHPELFSPYTS